MAAPETPSACASSAQPNSSWSWWLPRGRLPRGRGRPSRPTKRRLPRASGVRCCACAEAARPHSVRLAVRGEPGVLPKRAAALTGEWRALLRLARRGRAPALGAAGCACGAGRLGGRGGGAALGSGLGRRGCWRWRPWRGGLQLSALALSPAEVQVLRESGSEAEACGGAAPGAPHGAGRCALGALLPLASLAQAALAVLLYRAAGQRAVPAVPGSAGLVFLVGEVVPAAERALDVMLAPRALILSRLAVLLTLPVALPVGQLLEPAARPGRLRERVLGADAGRRRRPLQRSQQGRAALPDSGGRAQRPSRTASC